MTSLNAARGRAGRSNGRRGIAESEVSVLQGGEAVRADGDDDEQVGIGRDRLDQSRAGGGTLRLLRREQLLALVDRQDQGRRTCGIGLAGRLRA